MCSSSEWKEQGNACFKAGDLPGAADCYTKGLAAQDLPVTVGDSEAATLWCNRALVNAKRGLWGASLRDSECALLCEPTHAKARYRQGLAYLRLGEAAAACRALQQGATAAAPGSRQSSDMRRTLAEAAALLASAEQACPVANGVALARCILERAGFARSDVEVRDLPGYGRSLVARTKLPKGHTLVRLPAASAVSAATLRPNSRCAQLLSPTQASPESRVFPRTELALLMLEAMADASSPHEMYFSSLPEHIASPLQFQSAALDALHDGQLVDEIAWRHRAPLITEYIKLCNTTFWTEPAVWDEKVFSLDAFLRANILLSSRSLPDNVEQSFGALMPGIDLMNTPSEGDEDSLPPRACVRLEYPPGGGYDAVLESDCEAGQQLFIRYGSGKPNKHWMVNFGFVMPGNLAERIEVELWREGDLSQPHDELLRSLGAARSITLRLGFRESRVDDDIWVGLWVARLSEAEARAEGTRLAGALRAAVATVAEGVLGAVDLEDGVVATACGPDARPHNIELLKQALRTFLSTQRTSISDDTLELRNLAAAKQNAASPSGDGDPGMRANMRVAIEYRLAKKHLVAEALSALPACGKTHTCIP
jgi:hypothetical protein